MVSVKMITTSGESRAKIARQCKDDSKTIDIVSDNSSEEVPFSDDADDDSNWINVEDRKKAKKKVTTVTKSRKVGGTVQNRKKVQKVKVGHNALDKDLNMVKQYKVRYECCKKDLIKVDTSNGSANKDRQKFVKLEFQTRKFEAMKNKYEIVHRCVFQGLKMKVCNI
jgi:hypothetical protein